MARPATPPAPGATADPRGPLPDVLAHLGSDGDGLSEREAARRLVLRGPNTIVRRHEGSWGRRAAAQLTHPLALLLAAAAALALAGGLRPLAVAIAAVIVVNAAFALWQEQQAERAVEALAAFLPAEARVMRDGRLRTVTADLLVPGDVIEIQEGERISADARLLDGWIEVDASALTGESVPVVRAAEEGPSTDALIGAPALVFSGTACTSGEARAVVFATGMATQIGRIAALSQRRHEPMTPLQIEVRRVAWIITAVAVGAGAAFAPLGALAGLSLRDALIFAVGLLVANVPEGLLPTITLALAVGVRRLARAGALVKRLNAVETLGATTVICTDKTGTLTRNRMSVTERWTAGGVEARDLLASAAAACIADLDEAHGDPTELALLEAARADGIDVDATRRRDRQAAVFHFDPRLRIMSAVASSPDGAVIHVKGAIDAILPRCAGGQGEHEAAARQAEAMAASGLRVLSIARRQLSGPVPRAREDAERDLCLLGLVGLLDPPRPEAREAVARCHDAGIRIHILTGDHGLTAAAIARQVGIGAENPRTVAGADVDVMPDRDLDALLSGGEELVFARISPEGKLRVAESLRDLGEVVAMTGDGVNDAPALRTAHIGVAMGRTGSETVREASAMVLTDDDFDSIVVAVEEGRRVYANIRKFVTYIFAHAPAEVVPYLAFALSGGALPLPLTVMQILAIDLGTETLPALALGRERGEPGAMARPPRRHTDRVIDRALLRRAWLVLGGTSAVLVVAQFLWVLHIGGWSWGADVSDGLHDRATAATFLAIVACQIGAGIACRTEHAPLRSLGWGTNPLLLAGIAFEVAIAALVVWLPPLQPVFGTQGIGLREAAPLITFPALVVGVDALVRARAGRATPAGALRRRRAGCR